MPSLLLLISTSYLPIKITVVCALISNNCWFSKHTSFSANGASAFSDAGSLCHGWSAIPAYLYFAYVLGLKPTAPGYSSYQINRMACGIVDAHGLAVTPIGTIDLD